MIVRKLQIVISLSGIIFLSACGKSIKKEADLDTCINQAVSLFSIDKSVDRAWHVVGCMKSKGYKFNVKEPICQTDGNQRFLGSCYE